MAAMEVNEFIDSLKNPAPVQTFSNALAALWHEANGDWDKAHDLVQDNSPASCWVHAYLHRKEGDVSNAGYWYNRANQQAAQGSLEDEWEAIARDLLKREA